MDPALIGSRMRLQAGYIDPIAKRAVSLTDAIEIEIY
jgi:hypothetical protein